MISTCESTHEADRQGAMKVVGKKERALRLKDDINVVAQQSWTMAPAVPVLKRTELRQTNVGYGLVCSTTAVRCIAYSVLSQTLLVHCQC